MSKTFLCTITLMLVSFSCTLFNNFPKRTPQDALQDLGIENQNQFSLLNTCQQVEVFSKVGAEFLDIDHATALVPSWMYEEISKQPSDEVASCIVEKGELALSQLGSANNTEKESKALNVHALIYLAADLNLSRETKVKNFILTSMCNKDIIYRGSIGMYYYVIDEQDVYNFPSPTQILDMYCK